MAFKTGADCKFYLNNGSYGSPDWDELINAADVRLMDERDEDDMTRRGSGGFEETIATIRKISLEGDFIYDPEDTQYQTLFAAYQANTPIEVAMMDGDITVNDNEGIRFTGQIMKFERPQELRKGLRISFTIKPTPADNPPEWMVIGA